jgi:hypothetical protein
MCALVASRRRSHRCYAFQDGDSMIVRAGFQTFEFQRALELPKPLTFSSYEEALNWLKQISSQYPDMTSRFRDYLTRYSDNPETHMLAGHEAMERLAQLLYLRRIVVIVRQEATGGQPSAATPAAAPAFPLSERSQRATSGSVQPQTSDPPTFGPNADGSAQAAALVAAAADGKPFCPE